MSWSIKYLPYWVHPCRVEYIPVFLGECFQCGCQDLELGATFSGQLHGFSFGRISEMFAYTFSF